MNTLNENHSSPIEEKREQGYITTIGRERIRVVSVFVGTKSASKAIYDAAVEKILYDTKDNLQKNCGYCHVNLWHLLRE